MAHPQIDQALDLLYSGDTAGAEVLLQEAGGGKLEPPTQLPHLDQAAFFEALGGIKLAKQDGPGAEAAFRSMIQHEEKGGADKSGHATSYAKLAEALCLADKHDDSLAEFTKALTMKEAAGAAPTTLLNLIYRFADALFRKGKHKDAAAHFEKAVSYGEKSGADASTLANLVMYQADALKHYIAPLFGSVRLQKQMQGKNVPPQVLLLEQQLEGQYKQAIGLYQKAAELAEKAAMSPEFKLAIARAQGELHNDAGRPVKAVMARKKVIELAEKLKVDALELGFMYHGLGESTKAMDNAAEAIEAYRKAIALKEKGKADAVSLGKSWYSLGDCLGEAKKLDAALEAFTKARDLEDNSGATDDNHKLRRKKYWGAVAIVLQATGKEAEAKEAQKKADAI